MFFFRITIFKVFQGIAFFRRFSDIESLFAILLEKKLEEVIIYGRQC